MGIKESELRERIDKTAALMKEYDWDALFATPGTNFFYLSGIDLWRSERLIALVVFRQGIPLIICPAFEKKRMEASPFPFDITGWEETDDPYSMLASRAGERTGRQRFGIEPTTWFGDFQKLKAHFPRGSFDDGGPLFEESRIVKSPYEIDMMKRAVSLVEDMIQDMARELRADVSEKEVEGKLCSLMRERGCQGEALVQFGENSAVPHAVAGGKRLKRGEVALFDCVVRVEGYYSDITRTFCFGKASDKMKRIYAVVYEAQQKAIDRIREGVPCREIDRTAREFISEKGFGEFFIHRTGHGLGLDIHEEPYLVEGNGKPLAAGNVVTVEPGIYIPGEFGVRIEEDVVVTREGREVLSRKAPDLVELTV